MFFVILGLLGLFFVAFICRRNYLNLGESEYVELEVERIKTPDSSDIDQGMSDDIPYSDTDDEKPSQINNISEHIENIKNSLNEPTDNINYPFDKEISEETNKDKNE